MVKLIFLIFPVFILIACSSPRMNINVDELTSKYRKLPESYTAVSNDNLYMVASKYHLDYTKLAQLNNIQYPYKLNKGQRIYLTNNNSQISTHNNLNLHLDNTVKIIKKTAQPTAENTKEPIFIIQVDSNISKRTNKKYGIKWQWPINTKIIKHYKQQPKDYQGIDMQANLNDSIYAAADGIISYAGDDALSKYGKLIIINHKDTVLSAYAHLHKLLVDEGEEVYRGQLIAKAGKTGINKPKLHFEIRKDGLTKNPEIVLP